MGFVKASVIVVVTLLAVGAAAWALVTYAGLQASLIWTALIGAAAWAIRSNIEKKREHQRLLAERKREHYLEFLDFLAPVLKGQKEKEDQKSKRRNNKSAGADDISLDELRRWSLRLTLIGSDEVVQAWNTARLGEFSDDDPEGNMGPIRNWGKLWLAMRRDCGHLDTELNVSDVLSTFVNDIDEYRSKVDE